MSRVPPRGFRPEEFAERTVRAQALMAELGLAGMLLTTEPENALLHGFPYTLLAEPD